METRYRVFDVEHEDLYVAVLGHYFKLSEAKQVFKESKVSEAKDDSIMIEIAKNNTSEVDAILRFGVDEAERFALAMMNLCHSIKY
ncbi:hypothetical protein M670_01007 [Schinkia azotoformans MEV2011]|uniref:Uncharacterized protein n=1 Tax=Schinkia azotoformans MEV2011 TaxID=1348973 RepID=A0A072NSY0_SCHAZ|nr:hypothetical protein [Schinkia azotoformans]KEF39983.1 hypothetical protein M670_01007 [Schinkia azotoformans MEV2011]MEC1697281.1 hypothetical protein [Schinkia azotoformans]MEC1724320.1 hypothetical protein [Schinkia azotoformans]MEC1771523.1 hypothetical protein [Schinkia azotoformans]MED4367674.1 hypothetical protein [Schinkia azotoformans]